MTSAGVVSEARDYLDVSEGKPSPENLEPFQWKIRVQAALSQFERERAASSEDRTGSSPSCRAAASQSRTHRQGLTSVKKGRTRLRGQAVFKLHKNSCRKKRPK